MPVLELTQVRDARHALEEARCEGQTLLLRVSDLRSRFTQHRGQLQVILEPKPSTPLTGSEHDMTPIQGAYVCDGCGVGFDLWNVRFFFQGHFPRKWR